MTDQQIIQGLIDKDKHVTEEFFFQRCKPLLCDIINTVFDHRADYDELVNELYLYLMADDAAKLKGFQFRSSVYQWLKVLAIRFFIKLRDKGGVIDDESKESLYDCCRNVDNMEADTYNDAQKDLERLLEAMPNRRYAFVIRRLVVDDIEPKQLTEEMDLSTANLYNIKTRAIRQLTEIALKDIYEYDKH